MKGTVQATLTLLFLLGVNRTVLKKKQATQRVSILTITVVVMVCHCILYVFS